MDRELPDVSAHAVLESTKSAASKCIYGVSVMIDGVEAG
jgi:hypothetical protein